MEPTTSPLPHAPSELALAERENYLRAIIEAEPECVKLISEDCRLLDINPAGLAMLEADSQAQVLGGDMCQLIVPEHRGAFLDLTRRVFGGESGTLAFSIVGLKGTPRSLETRAAPLRDRTGRIVGAVGVTRDVTRQQEALAALQDSEARFRQLAEGIREVFWLADIETGRLIYVSPGFESIWGRSAEWLYEASENWSSTLHPDDRHRVIAAVAKLPAGHYDEEYRIVRPDGTIRWVRDKAFPVRDEQGRVIRIAGVADDVTERRLLDEHLRQTQKIESVGLLAGGIAHDFNNLLTVIGGNCDLALMALPPDHQATALITEVRLAAARAASLTRQLLTFSRRQVLHPEIVDLNTLVEETGNMLRRVVGDDVVVVIDLDPKLQRVTGDAASLSQVVINLAVNARDAMPAGGTLTIETRNVQLDDDGATFPDAAPGPYVRLSVRDTGVGMSAQVRARIFEPFFTTKDVGKGTGLGLSVVHGIIRQTGGYIDVASVEGQGTVISVYLPAATEAAVEAAPLPAAAPPPGTRVLLVEDDVSARRVVARTLRLNGYDVIEAGDGMAALRMLEDDGMAVDLLLTDVLMPGMNGRVLADAVRLRRPAARVLFTSGYPDDEVLHLGIERDQVSFLPKPHTAELLLKKVREALARTPPAR